ncbi:hypothetical protein HID58_086182 [Brassica napus]|uniref:Uncharacterized protein n=1 Tax=Brassica napus TaxID=3708 RepID=A0ABQ7XS93_BRANA|nr:hypothetical protein HID58_086182 [Brassica napus]
MLMDLTGAFRFRSGGVRPFREEKWLESLQLGGAVELLYFSDSPSLAFQAVADGSDIDMHSVHNLGRVLLLFLITQ